MCAANFPQKTTTIVCLGFFLHTSSMPFSLPYLPSSFLFPSPSFVHFSRKENADATMTRKIQTYCKNDAKNADASLARKTLMRKSNARKYKQKTDAITPMPREINTYDDEKRNRHVSCQALLPSFYSFCLFQLTNNFFKFPALVRRHC